MGGAAIDAFRTFLADESSSELLSSKPQSFQPLSTPPSAHKTFYRSTRDASRTLPQGNIDHVPRLLADSGYAGDFPCAALTVARSDEICMSKQGASELDAFSNGRFAGPEARRGGPIHQADEIGAGFVEVGECASFDERRSQHAEVIRRNCNILRHRALSRPVCAAFDSDGTCGAPSGKGEARAQQQVRDGSSFAAAAYRPCFVLALRIRSMPAEVFGPVLRSGRTAPLTPNAQQPSTSD